MCAKPPAKSSKHIERRKDKDKSTDNSVSACQVSTGLENSRGINRITADQQATLDAASIDLLHHVEDLEAS
jgi:hypothetical protein